MGGQTEIETSFIRSTPTRRSRSTPTWRSQPKN